MTTIDDTIARFEAALSQAADTDAPFYVTMLRIRDAWRTLEGTMKEMNSTGCHVHVCAISGLHSGTPREACRCVVPRYDSCALLVCALAYGSGRRLDFPPPRALRGCQGDELGGLDFGLARWLAVCWWPAAGGAIGGEGLRVGSSAIGKPRAAA